MTYREKFLDPRWQRVRLQALERDEWACQMCGDTTNTLHVHHRFYIRGCEPWEYDLCALVTLCAPCHESEPPVSHSGLQNMLAFELGWFFHEIEEIGPAFIESAGGFRHTMLASAYAHAIRMLDPKTVLDEYAKALAGEAENDTERPEGKDDARP